MRAQHDTLVEADFVDDVTRNLNEGRFLLMVVGDGIREGVERARGLPQAVRRHSIHIRACGAGHLRYAAR